MNAVTPNVTPIKSSTSIAIPTDGNPWEQYAAREGGNQLGQLIKYSKGRRFQGENEIAVGTEFLTLMRNAAIGDVRWEGGKPVEMKLGFIREGAQFAPCLQVVSALNL